MEKTISPVLANSTSIQRFSVNFIFKNVDVIKKKYFCQCDISISPCCFN